MLRVRVCKDAWTVRVAPESEFRSRFGDGTQRLYGLCEYATHTIWLREGMAWRRLVDTAVHEIFHAVTYYLRVGRVDEEAAAAEAGRVAASVLERLLPKAV